MSYEDLRKHLDFEEHSLESCAAPQLSKIRDKWVDIYVNGQQAKSLKKSLVSCSSFADKGSDSLMMVMGWAIHKEKQDD